MLILLGKPNKIAEYTVSLLLRKPREGEVFQEAGPADVNTADRDGASNALATAQTSAQTYTLEK